MKFSASHWSSSGTFLLQKIVGMGNIIVCMSVYKPADFMQILQFYCE